MYPYPPEKMCIGAWNLRLLLVLTCGGSLTRCDYSKVGRSERNTGLRYIWRTRKCSIDTQVKPLVFAFISLLHIDLVFSGWGKAGERGWGKTTPKLPLFGSCLALFWHFVSIHISIHNTIETIGTCNTYSVHHWYYLHKRHYI
jgi:hypothetical protein